MLESWEHDNRFEPGTVIRAETVNLKFDGIATNLGQIVWTLNHETVRFPEGFTGNTQIPNQTTANSLLFINENDDIALYPVATFDAQISEVASNTALTLSYRDTTRQTRDEVKQIHTQAVADTESIKSQAVTETQAIKGETEAIRNSAISAQSAAEQARDQSQASATTAANHASAASGHTETAKSWARQAESVVTQTTGLATSRDDTSGTISRIATTTEVFTYASGDITKTLDTATYNDGDVVQVVKGRQDFVLNIALTSGQIYLPDGTTTPTAFLPAGSTGVIKMQKTEADFYLVPH